MNGIQKFLSAAFSGILLTTLFAATLCASAAQATIHIEAETGQLFGTAEIAENENASGGKFVRELNVAKDYPNKVVFTIPSCAPGEYRLQLRYVSGTNGTVRFQVNGGDYKQFAFTLNMGNDWTWGPDSAQVVVYDKENITLKGDGTDTIMMQNGSPTGFAWIDWFELIPVKVGAAATPNTVSSAAAKASSATVGNASSAPAAVSSTPAVSLKPAVSSESALASDDTASSLSSDTGGETAGGFPWPAVIIGAVVVIGGGAAILWMVFKKKKA